MKKLVYQISAGVGISIIFTFFAHSAFAFTTPSFFSCLNPQTSPVISNQAGTHGVVGSSQTYTGMDSVYPQQGKTDLLSSSLVVQCLCPDNGSGIQTNWWDVSQLSSDDINALESEGWIYIPDGSAWGLNPVPYLAQNIDFSCMSSSQGGVLGGNNTNSGTQNNNNTGNNNSSNNNTTSSSSQNAPTQGVLGAFTSLAFTGGMLFVYFLFLIGIIATATALLLKKSNKNT